MKTTKISKLSFLPEEYGKKIYEKIDWSVIDSEMTDGQRRFINGLVQYYKPNKVLELGVSAGGGTTVLLNSMESYVGGGKFFTLLIVQNSFTEIQISR